MHVTRRALLLAAAPLAAAGAIAAHDQAAPPTSSEPGQASNTYRVTPHIRRYYEVARY